jgi:hypothetical protein
MSATKNINAEKIEGNLSISGITASTIVTSAITSDFYYGDGSNLSGISSDNFYVTGGTFNDVNSLIYFDRNDTLSAFTIDLSNIGTADTFVTGLTYDSNTYDLTLLQNEGQSDLVVNLSTLASDIYVVSGSYNISTGVVTYTNSTGGTFDVSGFTSGMTDSYTVNAILNGETIEFENNLQGANYYSIDLSPLLSGKTDLTLFNSHTGDTNNPHQTSFSNLTSTAHTHTLSEVTDFTSYSGSVQSQLDTKIENGINVGGQVEVFSGKSGTDLYFKTLSGGSNTVLTEDSGVITIETILPEDQNSYVTGFTYNDANVFIISRNGGLSDLSSTINTVTGLTVNGNLDVISGATVGGVLSADSITSPSIQIVGGVGQEGTFLWNSEDNTVDLNLNDVTLQLGQELHYHVINQTGEQINNGEVVYVVGVSSDKLSVAPYSISMDDVDADLVLGVATENIPNTEFGFVTRYGTIRDVNTSGFTVGTILYASTGSTYTDVAPNPPNHTILLGFVTKEDATEGSISLKVNHERDADEIKTNLSGSSLTSTNVQAALLELDANKLNVGSLSSNIILYPTTGTSVVGGGYLRMVTDTDDPDYNTTPVDVSTGAISNISGQLIASLVSDEGLFIGNPGVINIVTIGNIRKVSGNRDAYFYYELYKRDSGGTETLLSISDNTPNITNVNYGESFTSSLLSGHTWSSTDRVVIKYYGVKSTSSGQDPVYEFQFGGDSPVRTLLPVPVSVVPSEDADGIQTDTSNFNNILSGADTDVQKALDTLDDHSHTLQEVTSEGNITTDRIIIGDLTVDTNTIYTDGSGNVGIGTNNPQNELHVKGDSSIVRLETVSLSGSNFIDFWDPSNRKGYIGYGSSSTDRFVISNQESTGDIRFINNGQNSMIIDNESNVGIGTETPTRKLDIVGTDGEFEVDTEGLSLPNSTGTFLRSTNTSGATYSTIFNSGGIISYGVVGENNTSNIFGGPKDGFLYINNSLNDFNIYNLAGGTDNINLKAGGNWNETPDIHIHGSGITKGYIGIGTENPTEKLDIDGNVKISGTLYSNTISASTYNNLPIDPNFYVTGGTFSSETLTLNRNDGGNVVVTGFTTGGGSGEVNTASNVGGGVGIFSGKSGVDLQFKTLTSTGGTVSISSTGDTVNLDFLSSNQLSHKVKLARGAAQTINNLTLTKILFDTEVFDDGDLGDVTTNNRVNIQRNGKYYISCSYFFAGIDDNEYAGAYLYINGVNVRENFFSSPGLNNGIQINVSGVFDLAENDYIEMYAIHNEGSSFNTDTSNERRPVLEVFEITDWTFENTPVSPLTVSESDGTPTVNNVGTIFFPNGTVTDEGNGTVSVDFSGSTGGDGGLNNDVKIFNWFMNLT